MKAIQHHRNVPPRTQPCSQIIKVAHRNIYPQMEEGVNLENTTTIEPPTDNSKNPPTMLEAKVSTSVMDLNTPPIEAPATTAANDTLVTCTTEKPTTTTVATLLLQEDGIPETAILKLLAIDVIDSKLIDFTILITDKLFSQKFCLRIVFDPYISTIST